MNDLKEETNVTGLEIAVIGMAGRFPGAANIHEFWDNLKNGVESISFFSEAELLEAGVDGAQLNQPGYVRARGIIKDIDQFDAPFFNFTPREAEITDPQLRIFHEIAWGALEDAGYDSGVHDNLIGLYAGSAANHYWLSRTLYNPDINLPGRMKAQLLNTHFSTLISYHLNLKGPGLTINTACSTSLVTIHMACLGILSGECQMALAGGVSISPQASGYLYQEGTVASPDGHCRAFDSRAGGALFGDGVGVVVLKRLEDAEADGDSIHAVIKGTAINNDGFHKVGYTAPSVAGQAAVLEAALMTAEIDPQTVTYIETHGTATSLGDPVEIEALRTAFKTCKKQSIAVGSVKTNVGHLNVASGVTGFIKTVLALKHRLIPPSLHFENPNPKINFAGTPFYVNTRLRSWGNGDTPLRAGVSSFGLGGTNAHAVLEEWRGPGVKVNGSQYRQLILSARTPSALDRMTENLVDYLKTNPGVDLDAVAYTLQVGRRAFEYRRSLVCSGPLEAVEQLSSPGSRGVRTAAPVSSKAGSPFILFMFPGLGAQYEDMGLALYQKEPFFRQELDRCIEILTPIIGYNIRETLYPGLPSHPPPTAGGKSQAEIAPVSLFIFEYALAKLIMNWGIKPDAMMGYSFGEYAAACISGVFSLEDGLKLVVSRAQLIGRLPAGGMLSVPLGSGPIQPLLSAPLSIAVDNGETVVVAGPAAALGAFEKQMKKRGLMCMPVAHSHALHSSMMDPILGEFEAMVARVKLNKPGIPYISNVSGTWITESQAVDPAYWAKHLRETVRFARGVGELTKEKNAVFLETGPGSDLGALLKRYVDGGGGQQIINLVRRWGQKVPDDRYLLDKIGQLWLLGVPIDWRRFNAERRKNRLHLPTYPFEPHRFMPDGFVPVKSVKGHTGTLDIKTQVADLLRKEKELEKGPDIKGIENIPGLEGLLEEFCLAKIREYIVTGIPGLEKGRLYGKKELKQQLGIIPRFDKYYEFLIAQLAAFGHLREGDGDIEWLGPFFSAPGSVELEQRLRQEYPAVNGTTSAVNYIARHFRGVLSGETDAVGIMYPGGRHFRENDAYRDTLGPGKTGLYHQLVREVVLKALEHSSHKKPFRILEVGGGNGLLTRVIAPGLMGRPRGDVEYHFSDLGEFFLVKARKEAAEKGLDFMKFSRLDISKDPVSQDFGAGGYHMVLGLNVVHATPRIEETIEHLKTVLAPGGIMALIESVNPTLRTHLFNGFAEGWWYFDDPHLRSDSPLLDLDRWEQVMVQRGFGAVEVFPRPPERRRTARVGLILAQCETAPQRVPQKVPQSVPGYPVEHPVGGEIKLKPRLSSEYVAPRDEIERTVVEVFLDFFGFDQIGIRDDFFELGLDSLIATTLVSHINKRLGVRVPLVKMYDTGTVEQLAGYIKAMEPGEVVDDEGMVLLKKSGSGGAHFFLVHDGFGEIRGYVEFCNILNVGRDCWALRAEREDHPGPFNTSVEELARHYIAKIRRIQPRGPYVIAGWSFGGILAFEITRQLEGLEGERGILGIIDIGAPPVELTQRPEAFTTESELKWVGEHFADGRLDRRLQSVDNVPDLWRRVKAYLEEKYRENERDAVERVKRVIPRHLHEGVPRIDRLGIGELLHYLNRLRTFANAQRGYVPPNRIDSALHYFGAREGGGRRGVHWDEFASSPVTRHTVSGTHFSIFRDPHVKELAGIFSGLL